MDDESERLEIDVRLRATFAPPDDVVDRVVRQSLAGTDRKRRSTFVWVFAAAAIAMLIGTVTLRQRGQGQRQPAASSITIVGDGSMLVVERNDGRRWLIGPRQDRLTQGNYVILISQ